MAAAQLLRKLRMQPGHRVLILNAPAGYVDTLGELPEGVEVAERAEGTFDFVQAFARDLAELEGLALVAVEAVKHDGLLWISYPRRALGQRAISTETWCGRLWLRRDCARCLKSRWTMCGLP